MKFEAKMIY